MHENENFYKEITLMTHFLYSKWVRCEAFPGTPVNDADKLSYQLSGKIGARELKKGQEIKKGILE